MGGVCGAVRDLSRGGSGGTSPTPGGGATPDTDGAAGACGKRHRVVSAVTRRRQRRPRTAVLWREAGSLTGDGVVVSKGQIQHASTMSLKEIVHL